jgi:hypothetical protein
VTKKALAAAADRGAGTLARHVPTRGDAQLF